MSIKYQPLVTARTAQRDLIRGFRFLGTLSRTPVLFTHLARTAGYNSAEHQHGWDLLLVASGQTTPVQPGPEPAIPQTEAVAEIDSWDGVTFERARPVLKYRYPDQYHYLFNGLTAKQGSQAVGSAKLFLDRFAALRDGTDPTREGSRDADRQAMALLAERRIVNDEIFAHMMGVIEQAQAAPILPPEPLAPEPTPEERQQAADALHVWLTDWSAQARAAIQRGDYLVRLGLASPRSARGEEDIDDDVDDPSVNVA
jgi:hypothetical protein